MGVSFGYFRFQSAMLLFQLCEMRVNRHPNPPFLIAAPVIFGQTSHQAAVCHVGPQSRVCLTTGKQVYADLCEVLYSQHTRSQTSMFGRVVLVVEAMNHREVRSCLIDGEAVCCDEKGGAAFQLLRHRRNEPRAFLYVFDLPELNGTGLRREPIEVRKATLASILRKSRHGVRPNEHLEHGCGLTVFQHARKMGLEGCRATWPPSGYPCPSQSCFRTLRSARACLQNRRNPDWSGNAVSCP
jgi:hypothetical protein